MELRTGCRAPSAILEIVGVALGVGHRPPYLKSLVWLVEFVSHTDSTILSRELCNCALYGMAEQSRRYIFCM